MQLKVIFTTGIGQSNYYSTLRIHTHARIPQMPYFDVKMWTQIQGCPSFYQCDTFIHTC